MGGVKEKGYRHYEGRHRNCHPGASPSQLTAHVTPLASSYPATTAGANEEQANRIFNKGKG